MVYRVLYSLVVYIGATTTLEIAWTFSDIANALMAIPNLLCLLLMSGEIARDMRAFQDTVSAEKRMRKADRLANRNPAHVFTVKGGRQKPPPFLSINFHHKANNINGNVSIKPFQRFAVSKGGAFGCFPQKAKHFYAVK